MYHTILQNVYLQSMTLIVFLSYSIHDWFTNICYISSNVLTGIYLKVMVRDCLLCYRRN